SLSLSLSLIPPLILSLTPSPPPPPASAPSLVPGDRLDLRRVDELCHLRERVELRLGGGELLGGRTGRGIRRHEEGAAILVRRDRSGVGADPMRLVDDMALVDADERPQDGNLDGSL